MTTSFISWTGGWIVQNYIPLCFALITIGFFIGWDMRLEDAGEEKPQSSAD
jgi:hypothetical protein